MYRIDGNPFPTVTDDAIRGFVGDYKWLSNFELATIEVEHMPGLKFASVEHAYMASKTLVPEEITKLTLDGGLTPAKAKAYGQTVTLRRAWDSRRYTFMKKCVRAKFAQHKHLANMLLDTGGKYLEEANDWGDRYWGVVGDSGQNNMGNILMGIREELRDQRLKQRQDQEAAELEYLRYFYQSADFGPAHEDVVGDINKGWGVSGQKVPEGY